MFDAAARHLNFRLAAEELHLTQGAVAQQVRRLEADLGLRLFDRKPRGLSLTEIGRSYHNSIRRGLAIIDEATEKLDPRVTSKRAPKVTLSVTPSFAAKWLVPRLGDFAQEHPDIDLRTVASESLSDFRTDGVDLAIRYARTPKADGLHVEPLAPIDLCAVCSPEFAEAIGPVNRLEDLAGQPLFQDSHNHWDALFEDAALTDRGRIMQFNQTALAMDAAITGRGVALAPWLLVEAELAKGTLVEIWRDTRTDQGGYFIVYPDHWGPDPTRQAVIDWIRTQVRKSSGRHT